MLADPGGYVPLLALARHWAAAARVPPEMVLRRLCDWAMVGAFRAGAFVTRRGDPVDPFDMFVSCRAADEGLGGGVSLGHYKQYGNLQGPEFLAGVIVSIQDVLTFCNRTGTVPPPRFSGRAGRLWTILKRGKHLSPPPCPDAEARAIEHNDSRMAEGFLNSLRDMLAGFQGKPTGSTLPLVRSQGNEPINFGYWTPRWEQLWHRARNAIDRSGGRELQPVLDALGDKWAALKQAETDRVASATRGPVDSATDSMEPIDRAPEPRFRIKRSQRLVLIDGNARSLSEQLLKLLCLLATNAQLGDRFVPNKEIEELLWGTNLHRIARPVADVVRELRDALAGKNGDRGEIRKLIQTQPRVGTRLALAPKEIAIEE